MVKRMYNINDKYLYEILDDFKDAQSEEEKDEIVNEFMKLIWASKNKRVVNKKYITFKVLSGLLDTDIGKIFNKYSSIEYTSYKSMSKQQDFVNLIRQKINNLYTNHCDGRVCIRKEYMDLIKKPKQMYYRWKNGEEFDTNTLTSQIEEIMKQSEVVKEKYAKQKMDIEWTEYKTLIAPYFKRMFNNYIPLEDFEDKTKLVINSESWNEDNFAIAYLCKGLDGYMRMYQKKYYNVPEHKTYRRCECGGMFVQSKKNNRFKCDKCGNYQPIGTKTITCIDCGKEVVVDAKDTKTNRCDNCYKIYRHNRKLETQRIRRLKDKMKSEQF